LKENISNHQKDHVQIEEKIFMVLCEIKSLALYVHICFNPQ
ncbi:3046_t:CDS:1, partial [Dentiscutata erythropus]